MPANRKDGWEKASKRTNERLQAWLHITSSIYTPVSEVLAQILQYLIQTATWDLSEESGLGVDNQSCLHSQAAKANQTVPLGRSCPSSEIEVSFCLPPFDCSSLLPRFSYCSSSLMGSMLWSMVEASSSIPVGSAAAAPGAGLQKGIKSHQYYGTITYLYAYIYIIIYI